jgi:hypothetical protein
MRLAKECRAFVTAGDLSHLVLSALVRHHTVRMKDLYFHALDILVCGSLNLVKVHELRILQNYGLAIEDVLQIDNLSLLLFGDRHCLLLFLHFLYHHRGLDLSRDLVSQAVYLFTQLPDRSLILLYSALEH